MEFGRVVSFYGLLVHDRAVGATAQQRSGATVRFHGGFGPWLQKGNFIEETMDHGKWENPKENGDLTTINGDFMVV